MVSKKKQRTADTVEYSQEKAELAVASLVADLLEQVPAETCVVVAANLLARAWCLKYGNKVPAEGEDFQISNLTVSVFPTVDAETKERIEREMRESANEQTEQTNEAER